MKLRSSLPFIRKILIKYNLFITLETIGVLIISLIAALKGSLNNIYIVSLIFLATIHITFYITRLVIKKSLLKNLDNKIQRVEFQDKKRESILLEAGRLCSWQFSSKARILKLDNNSYRLLGTNKIYFTFEELSFNMDLKRIISNVEDGLIDNIDEEIFIPELNRWFIVRGRCVEVDRTLRPNQFIGIILDNTERRNYQKRLELLSITDELTGLKNRRYFFDHFQIELNHYSRKKSLFTLALFDLDHFKVINDTWGHLAGDKVLQFFSSLLTEEVRPYDLVARFGGEEFVVLFPDIDKESASSIVERIKKKLDLSACLFDDQEINFTFSCGIGDSSELGLCTEKEFVTIIDQRLYEAKNSGRNLIITGG